MSRFRTLIALLAVGAALAATAAIALAQSASPPASGDPGQADRDAHARYVVDQVFPGATTRFSNTADAMPSAGAVSPNGRALVVQLAGQAAPEGSDLERQFAFARAGWRAELAAAATVDNGSDITSFQLLYDNGTRPQAADNDLQGILRPSAETPLNHGAKLGSIAERTAREQLRSNLTVLAGVLPDGTIKTSTIRTVPVDPSEGLFALEADITVTSADALVGHYGDVLNGLATGLTGSPDAVIEGLAIDVSANGEPLIGSWQAARASEGTTKFDPAIHPPDALVATVPFPDITGGPPTMVSGHG